mmetsp:Transcript_3102/g.8002  ORF Transcript_3102/g.8002 Transcript_3102/m.8002 type:complete len:209 (-) Transcript_3102:312-938(-)
MFSPRVVRWSAVVDAPKKSEAADRHVFRRYAKFVLKLSACRAYASQHRASHLLVAWQAPALRRLHLVVTVDSCAAHLVRNLPVQRMRAARICPSERERHLGRRSLLQDEFVIGCEQEDGEGAVRLLAERVVRERVTVVLVVVSDEFVVRVDEYALVLVHEVELRQSFCGPRFQRTHDVVAPRGLLQETGRVPTTGRYSCRRWCCWRWW